VFEKRSRFIFAVIRFSQTFYTPFLTQSKEIEEAYQLFLKKTADTQPQSLSLQSLPTGTSTIPLHSTATPPPPPAANAAPSLFGGFVPLSAPPPSSTVEINLNIGVYVIDFVGMTQVMDCRSWVNVHEVTVVFPREFSHLKVLCV
jgi:hypothetical protein